MAGSLTSAGVKPGTTQPYFSMAGKQKTDLRAEILRLIRDPKYRPLDKIEIANALGYDAAQRNEVRRTLRDLEKEGEIARIRKNRYVQPDTADLVTGTLSVHEAGYAFLTNEKKGQADLFIAAENTGTAMHGDHVVARIIRGAEFSRARTPRAEGRVIRILTRANETIVGTLQQTRNFFYVVPDDPRLVHNIYVQPSRVNHHEPRRDDKVVVRLEAWESRHVNPEGKIIECLGPRTAPGVDILSIIRKYHLPLEFPKAILEEASAISETVTLIDGREDLRQQFIVTIDPDDARDFDDAIQVEEIKSGWQLGVHIADVSAYVRPGSALDREAQRRGNSVYLPDRVIPMLPEQLSNGVCSLNPHVDRLTHSVFLQFDRNGRVRQTRFARTVIRSAHRLTYKQAFAILKSSARDELSERLHTAWKLAALLRRKRFEHGSLDLDMPEVKVVVDKKGKPIRFERVENDESHQLIEEFMLAANEAVARELKNRGIPTIYRVHENPEAERLGELREFVLAHGIRVGDLTHRGEVQKLLAAIRGTAEEHPLKIALLKSLKRARYATTPLGHYGLAKVNYAHFTSPIRRYADLEVHRALADRDISRRSSRASSQLSAIADHISDTERNAAEAEIDAVKMKKLEFFELQLQARDPQVFDAVVIDVRNYGILVELPEILLTGLIHVSTLADDFYVFSPSQRRFVGRQRRRRFAVGDKLRVHVARVDQFKRQIDFAIADLRPGPDRQPRKRRR
ncbi:MAG TPA: ribonuclease R [Chthoniobacterales bacterium]|nr:ribonuclease R [Chthoniobacterales bacterium]